METRKSKTGAKAPSTKAKPGEKRQYDSEAAALLSLRMIAAPNPKDDLSDEQLAEICLDSSYSAELIKHLIDCIKGI